MQKSVLIIHSCSEGKISDPALQVLYTPSFPRTVIFAVLTRCGHSRVVNFAILLMLSLL